MLCDIECLYAMRIPDSEAILRPTTWDDSCSSQVILDC